MLLVAAVFFVVVSVLAYRSLPRLEHGIDWRPIAMLAVVGAPGMVLINIIEFRILADLLGHDVRFGQAARVSLLSSAANLLPVPGAALVRIQALLQLGSRAGEATLATTSLGVVWVGATGVAAGTALLILDHAPLALPVGIGGLVALTLAGAVVRRVTSRGSWKRVFASMAAAETCFLLLTSLQFFLALRAIGFEVTFVQGVIFTIPVVLGAAIGFLPGGLGIREAVAAAVSPLAGLPVAAGALAAALDRLVAGAVLSVLAAVLALRRRSAADLHPDR